MVYSKLITRYGKTFFLSTYAHRTKIVNCIEFTWRVKMRAQRCNRKMMDICITMNLHISVCFLEEIKNKAEQAVELGDNTIDICVAFPLISRENHIFIKTAIYLPIIRMIICLKFDDHNQSFRGRNKSVAISIDYNKIYQDLFLVYQLSISKITALHCIQPQKQSFTRQKAIRKERRQVQEK